MKRTLLFAALILIALSSVAQTQQPPFSDRVDVNVVLLDAVVADSDGNQILGLDKEDFVVRENGVEQTIDSVDYFTSRKLLNAREENAPFKVERVREERYVIFFFDKPAPGSGVSDWLNLARRSARRFVDEDLLEGDRVAIVGHDVRLKVYSDFTNDKDQLRRALDQVHLFGPGVTRAASGSGPSILRNVDSKDMMGGTGTAYQALTTLADSLRPIRARKNMVVFSPGILEPGDEIRGGIVVAHSRFLEPAINALNRSNVAVFGINALINTMNPPPAVHTSLERISNETNGRYFRNTTSFDPALEQIEKSTSGYYLISYRPTSRRTNRGFQKVEVTVRNREFRVKSRAGYVVD